MNIAGIDLGVHKAAYSRFVDGELADVGHFDLSMTPRHKELHVLCTSIWLKVGNCDAVYIEEPLIGRGVRTSLKIAQTAGAVMSELHAVPYLDLVPVASWKKEVVGSGSSDKAAIASWLRDNFPSYSSLCAGNQDRVDATCIGLYGVKVDERAKLLEDL